MDEQNVLNRDHYSFPPGMDVEKLKSRIKQIDGEDADFDWIDDDWKDVELGDDFIEDVSQARIAEMLNPPRHPFETRDPAETERDLKRWAEEEKDRNWDKENISEDAKRFMKGDMDYFRNLTAPPREAWEDDNATEFNWKSEYPKKLWVGRPDLSLVDNETGVLKPEHAGILDDVIDDGADYGDAMVDLFKLAREQDAARSTNDEEQAVVDTPTEKTPQNVLLSSNIHRQTGVLYRNVLRGAIINDVLPNSNHPPLKLHVSSLILPFSFFILPFASLVVIIRRNR